MNENTWTSRPSNTSAQEPFGSEATTIDVVEDSLVMDEPASGQLPPDPSRDIYFRQFEEVHYLKNLRAFLIMQLIVNDLLLQFAFDEGTGFNHGRSYRLIYVFAAINRMSLWNLIIFSSGISISTFIQTFVLHTPMEYRHALAISKVVLPSLLALFYFMGAQILLLAILSIWQLTVGGLEQREFLPLWGPSQYVRGLSVLEALYFFVHWSDVATYLSALPTSRPRLYLWLCFISFLLLLISIIFSLMPIEQELHLPVKWLVYQPYHNLPAADTPFFFVLAYLAGICFSHIQKHVLVSMTTAYIILFASLSLAYTSLAFSQDLATSYILNVSNPFAVSIFFPREGFSLHTAFFVISNTITFLALPISFTSIFSQSTWATRYWGYWTENIYFSTYVHLLPISLAIYYLKGHPNFMSSVFFGPVLVIGGSYAATVPFSLWNRLYSGPGAIFLNRDAEQSTDQ